MTSQTSSWIAHGGASSDTSFNLHDLTWYSWNYGEKQLLIFKGVVSDVWSYFKADWETVGLQSHSSPCTIEEFKLLPYWERVYYACHPALFLPQKPHKEVKKQIWYLTVNHLARRLRWDDVKHCSSTLNSLAQASAPFDAMETICTV